MNLGCYFLSVVASVVVSMTAVDPALCQVSPLPGSNVMISPVGGGNLAPRALVSADLFQGGSCPTTQLFYNNAGAVSCEAPGSGGVGTVTSVGQSFTGGLISVGGSPITTSGTLALTVAGTSGGVPYFASGTTWASSGVLAAGQIVLGGGAGVAPGTSIGLGTTTQLLHGNAGGAPSFGAIVSADVSTVLASPPAIGSTSPNVGTFLNRPRSLQSFGAAGISSAINSPPISVTIASPAVVTWTGSNMVAGQPIVFYTNGLLPTGMTAGTTYYVIAAGLGANSFEFSTSVGGAAVNTSGSQSGTLTAEISSAAVSIASPGVVSWTAHGLVANQPIVFLTTSALPTGLSASTTYYVAAAGLTANSFQVCAASGCGGGSINTSGTQTGVQSIFTDDTASIQTALNSGFPLICNGNFGVNSLITDTNVSATIVGTGMPEGCIFNFTSTTSGFYFTYYGAERTSNRIRIENLKVIPQASITANGAPHTAAFDIEYPLGTSGTVSANVYIKNVEIMPSSDVNYIVNGIYINDTQTAHIDDFHFEGKRNTTDINSSAVVLTGSHAPTTLTLEHALISYAGAGLLMPQVASKGWQGVRVNNVDCVFCYYGVQAFGALDGSSDYLSVTGLEGAYFQSAVTSQNVGHTFIASNYVFLFNPSAGTITSPTCFNINWTMTPLSNITPAAIYGNACDGAQASGYIGSKIGVIYGGFGNASLAGYVGPNNLADLDLGVFTPSGVNNIFVAKQTIRNVTTEWTNGAAAGNVIAIPPMAVTDGSAQPAGLVGEVIRASVLQATPVSIVTGTPKTISSITLTPGDWDCRGEVGFAPNAATTISFEGGGLSTVTNVLPGLGLGGMIYQLLPFTTGQNSAYPLATTQVNVSASTNYFLVAQSNFAVNTNAAYGTIECRRMR